MTETPFLVPERFKILAICKCRVVKEYFSCSTGKMKEFYSRWRIQSKSLLVKLV